MCADRAISTSARDIIDTSGVVTYFQPILSARQRSVVGAEALSRGVIGVEALARANTIAVADEPTSVDQIILPGKLFSMAAAEGLTLEMEKLCRITAIRT